MASGFVDTSDDDVAYDPHSLPSFYDDDQDPAGAAAAGTPQGGSEEQSDGEEADETEGESGGTAEDDDTDQDLDDSDEDDEEQSEADGDEAEEGQEGDEADFDPTNPDTWPEESQPHVRAAQARITRYEQELATKLERVNRLGELADVLATTGIPAADVAAVVRQLPLLALQGQYPGAQGAGGFPGGADAAPSPYAPNPYAPTAPAYVPAANVPNAPLTPEAANLLTQAHAIKDALDNEQYSTDVEELTLRSQLQSISFLYNQAQEQARSQARQQEATRSSAQDTELTRLATDARFKAFLADPQTKQSILEDAKKQPGLPIEEIVKARHYDQMLIDAAKRERAARTAGRTEGRTKRAASDQASLPSGQGTRTVTATQAMPVDVRRDPHKIMQWQRNHGNVK